MSEFSDYIVYADESGSASLDGHPDPGFPLFVLVMTLVSKTAYATEVVPHLQQLKFVHVGHDQLILHERDIRRQQENFAFLRVNSARRERFLTEINALVADAPLEVFAAIIRKQALIERYAYPRSPYELALHFLTEKILMRLLSLNQEGKLIHIVFECRGKKEDRELELVFRRIAANEGQWGYRNLDFSQLRWEPIFADKKSNSAGLQLADLFARPIGLKILRPTQPNRAFDVIQPKIAHNGLKCFP